MLRRFSLSVAPRFLWECLTSQTVNWFPAPAASNPSCRFPAMGLPACFESRVMRRFCLTKHQSLKFSYSDGTYIRYGGNYQNVSAAWQYSWLGRPN